MPPPAPPRRADTLFVGVFRRGWAGLGVGVLGARRACAAPPGPWPPAQVHMGASSRGLADMNSCALNHRELAGLMTPRPSARGHGRDRTNIWPK